MVDIHSDSLKVVKVIHDSASKSSNSALIRRIHGMLSQEKNWTLRYIPTEENKCANLITKMAYERKKYLQVIEAPPKEVLALIKADKENILCIPNSRHVT